MLRSRSCVIGRGVWMFSICSAMALASNTPTQIGSTFCPSLSRRMMIGMLVIGIDHQALDVHLDQHECLRTLATAARRRTVEPRRRRGTASPQTLFGPARSIVTSTNCPSHSGGPGKLTTVLPLVRPVSSHSRRRLVASTSTCARRSNRPLEEVRLDRPLERLQRHDAPRLLRLRHIVRHPLRRQRVRPLRVLEREHAVVAEPPRSATASPRSPRPSLLGSQRSYRSIAARSG